MEVAFLVVSIAGILALVIFSWALPRIRERPALDLTYNRGKYGTRGGRPDMLDFYCRGQITIVNNSPFSAYDVSITDFVLREASVAEYKKLLNPGDSLAIGVEIAYDVEHPESGPEARRLRDERASVLAEERVSFIVTYRNKFRKKFVEKWPGERT